MTRKTKGCIIYTMTKKHQLFCFSGIIAITAGILLILNYFTPMIVDDYNYSFSFSTGQRITNPLQIIPSMLAHYNIQGGRLLVHALAQLFLMLPGWLFDIINTIGFLTFSFILYFFAYSKKNLCCLSYLFLLACVWIYTPIFAQTCLWEVGSANYLWGCIISFGWLLFFYKLVQNPSVKKWQTIVSGVWAFAAGFCNENTSAAVLLAAGFFVLIFIYENRTLKLWMFLSGLSGFCGWIIMILAPGNKQRSINEGVDSEITLRLLFSRFINCTWKMSDVLPHVIAFCVVLHCVAIALKVNQKILLRSGAMMLSGFACCYAMMGAPYSSDRSFMGSFAFFCISSLLLIPEIIKSDLKPFFYGLCGLVCVTAYFSVVSAVNHNYLNYNLWLTRQEDVMSQAASGSELIETFAIGSVSKYSVFNGLEDLNQDPDHWANHAYSKYYNIGSVTITERKYN